MERGKLLLLSAILAAGYLVTIIISAPPTLSGLSTVLGTTILGTTVLGSSVLGVSVLDALALFQLYISLACIGLLVFLELTDPAYGGVKGFLVELRTNWLPHVILLLILFSLIVAFRVVAIIG